MNANVNIRRVALSCLAALITGCFVMLPIVANATALITQGFLASSNLVAGTLVSLQKNSTDFVTSSNTSNANDILGIVIDNNASEVSLSATGKNQVQVATSGVNEGLVSDVNGNISVGDPITSSPIAGVGMKATSNVKIVGLANENFPNSTASKETYTDSKGQKQTVVLGSIPITINLSYYYKQPNKTIIPPAIQNLANALAGKTVNSLPILLSIGIFFITLIIVVSIIYSMIHSSIISVGRNPMAQSAIYRNVIQLSILVAIILGVAVMSIYMILTRL